MATINDNKALEHKYIVHDCDTKHSRHWTERYFGIYFNHVQLSIPLNFTSFSHFEKFTTLCKCQNVNFITILLTTEDAKLFKRKWKTAENPVKNLNDKEIFGKFFSAFQWIFSAANRKPKQTRTIVDVIELNISVYCDAGNGKMISSTGIYTVLSMSFVCSMYNVPCTCDMRHATKRTTKKVKLRSNTTTNQQKVRFSFVIVARYLCHDRIAEFSKAKV